MMRRWEWSVFPWKHLTMQTIYNPKVEIWIDEKLDMIKTLDSVVEHRSDSGVMGRLMALLEVHENR